MKQVLRKGLKDIVVDDVPDPVASPHHVLVRTYCSLISSGTETASIHQEGLLRGVAENPSQIRKIWDAMKVAGPIRTVAEVQAKLNEFAVLGYAGAGVVVERHPTVRDLEIGDRVAYGGEGTGHAETIVTGCNLVAKIPDQVTYEQGCFTTLGSIALNAVRIAELGVGDVAVVVGLGLVGQLVAQLARAQGAVVITTDLRRDRVELSRRLGADYAIGGEGGLEQQIAAITRGRGADRVIVAAASHSSVPCQLALRLCRDRGRIVVVGAVEMSFPWIEMYMKEIQIFMARAYGPGSYDPTYEREGRDYPDAYVRWTEHRNMEEFLRLVATGRIDVASLVSHTFALDDAERAYQTIMAPGSTSLAVLLRYPVASDAGRGAPAYAPRRKLAVAPPARSDGRLRVALVGAGNLARWSHLPNLRQSSIGRLHAVCSASGPRGKQYAMRFGASYCTTEYDEILGDADVDVVLIVSRNQHHAPQALAALNAGKHVFLEKPMALTEEECRQLHQAVKSSKRSLTVGFNRRFAPYYVAMKSALSRRQTPAVINCRVNSPGISGKYWMADPAIGGAILGEACHFTDLMYWLLESEPVKVSATSLPRGTTEPIGENNVAATFAFADGSVANLTYCTVGSRTSGGERVEVYAPGIGVATEDFKWLQIRGARRTTRSRWWPDKGYAVQLEGFLADIRAGREPAVDVVDGARATLSCLRLLDAAREGTSVSVDLAAILADDSEVTPSSMHSNH